MDPSLYKDIKTTRGFTYRYFYLPHKDISKPYILFLHGFPSTSQDWRKQVPFFAAKGFGVIAPDLLGFGSTDKPLDLTAYKFSLMTKDIIDILDAESIHKCIIVGHDWGSKLTGRLANYFPDRFLGFAFLSLSYPVPRTSFDIAAALALTKQLFGYEAFGYWLFFSEEDASEIIDSHKDTFFRLVFTGNPKDWATDLAPTGVLRAALLADKKFTFPAWLSEEEMQAQKASWPKGSFTAALSFYRIVTSGIDSDDDKGIPEERYRIDAPVFFGAAAHDAVCIAAIGMKSLELCTKSTTKTFETGHWPHFEDTENVNKELLQWIDTI